MAKGKQNKGSSGGGGGAKNDAKNDALLRMRPRAHFLGALLGGGIGWLILQRAGAHVVSWVGAKNGGITMGVVLGAIAGGVIAHFAVKVLFAANQRRIIRPYGLAISVIFIVVWIIPIAITGGFKTSVPGYPPYMNNMYRIACLFTHSSSNWKSVHYQIRFQGSDEWVEGFEPGFFDQGIFGHRTRFNRIIGQTRRGGARGQGRQREIAEFIAKRWKKQLYPEDPPITHVRYLRVPHKVGGDQCMTMGDWTKPTLDVMPEDERNVLATHDLTKRFRYKRRSRKRAKPRRAKPRVIKRAKPKAARIAPGRSAPGKAASETKAKSDAKGGTK